MTWTCGSARRAARGPVAASLASFESYHRIPLDVGALALTRARPVCGDASLVAELAAHIRAALCEARDKTRCWRM